MKTTIDEISTSYPIMDLARRFGVPLEIAYSHADAMVRFHSEGFGAVGCWERAADRWVEAMQACYEFDELLFGAMRRSGVIL